MTLARSDASEIGDVLDGGGSTANLRRAVTREGHLVVVKHVARRADAVDGHDLASFRRKILHQRWLRACGGSVGRRYPRIRGERHTAAGSSVAMDWHAGRPLIEVLAARGEQSAGMLAALLEDLFASGYERANVPATDDRVHAMYAGRVARRLRYLRSTPLRPIVEAPTIVVGPVVVRGPARALAEIVRDPRLRAAASPRRLAFPLHGDLNLRNVLVRDGVPTVCPDYSLLDPRGELRPWDPMYDVAKLAFSALLFEELSAHGAEVIRDRRSAEVRLRASWHRLRGVTRAVALGIEACDHVTGQEGWQARLGFATAAHALAEAACRVSVARARSARVDDGARAAGCALESAAALLVLGALLLEQWRDGIATGRPPRVEDQRALLSAYAAPALP